MIHIHPETLTTGNGGSVARLVACDKSTVHLTVSFNHPIEYCAFLSMGAVQNNHQSRKERITTEIM